MMLRCQSMGKSMFPCKHHFLLPSDVAFSAAMSDDPVPTDARTAEVGLLDADPGPDEAAAASTPAAKEDGGATSKAPTSELPRAVALERPHAEKHGEGTTDHGRAFVPLALAALGVVYGDIGTSPLYAMRECFLPPHGVEPTPDNVLGILSLVCWSLVIVVSLKYLEYVMRMDDKGEGGILALMALAARSSRGRGIGIVITVLGLFGSGLLFGDGIITPAISVLSAVEGLGLFATSLKSYVVPLTIIVLVALFFVQSRGTEKVGSVFGPIIVVWFLALAAIGTSQIIGNPEVLLAVSPVHAVRFFLRNHLHGFLVLGSVFLAVTGGEALYADMGHFGRQPIRITWYGLVLPALVLNYFGQGALILTSPEASSDPFYLACPRWGLLPMVILSTAATVIASQAVISGVFSLTRQAMMLGFWPRMKIEHTSPTLVGQIYVPAVNWAMMTATILLVVGFGHSTHLAAAYGIAVTATMVITTSLAFMVSRYIWGWRFWTAVALTVPLIVIDAAFLSANLVKIAAGGWLPLAVAAFIFVLMQTWHDGRRLLGERVRAALVPIEDFFELMHLERPARVPGTAVFMTSNREYCPPALMNNFMHNRVVHENVVLLTVSAAETARVPADQRLEVSTLQHGFVRVVARFGYMETPDVPALLDAAKMPDFSHEFTTYFLGREAVLAEKSHSLSWRMKLFAVMSRNAASATAFFNIPTDHVMEIGAQIRL